MRLKFFFLVSALFVVNLVFAVNTPPVNKPRLKANEILIPIGPGGEKISLLDLSVINIKEVQEYTGQKMKFADRLAFKAAQNKLRQSINNDGTINDKKVTKFFAKQRAGETGFHIGGFALGALLGLIGVLIAYLIKDDYKRNRVKWAWIGWALYVAIVVVVFLA